MKPTKMPGARGQLAHPLNWILVLIAGAFFLLLFIAILRLMTDTDKDLSGVKTLGRAQSIIDTSQANPGTQAVHELPALETRCEAGNPYTIELSGQTREYPTYALFSPRELIGATTTWSQEFSFPAPISTITYLFPENTIVIILDSGSSSTNVPQAIIDLIDINKKIVPLADLEMYNTRGYDLVIVLSAVDLEGKKVNTKAQVHGVKVGTDPTAKEYGELTFYTYTGTTGFTTPAILNSATATYPTKELLLAGLFAGTQERYVCGRNTIIERMLFLAELERERITRINDGSWPEKCTIAYNQALVQYAHLIAELSGNGMNNPLILNNYKAQLLIQQNALRREGCPALR